MLLRAPIHIAALMRPMYWAKNLLIFVPVYLADALQQPYQLANCSFGFLLFCLCASGTYIFNDWADAAKDAAHITKKNRPLASGEISSHAALSISVALLASALLLGLFWRVEVALWLAVYVAGSAAYTMWLKYILVVDGLMLSGLHLLRLWVGCVIAAIPFSPALIAFSLLFFFSLSMAKRYGEIRWMVTQNLVVETGRPYNESNLTAILIIGLGTAGAAIGVLVLYAAQYFPTTPVLLDTNLLWFEIAVVGAWLIYVWTCALQGLLTTDPIAFALKDRVSLFFLVLLLASLILSGKLTPR